MPPTEKEYLNWWYAKKMLHKTHIWEFCVQEGKIPQWVVDMDVSLPSDKWWDEILHA